MICKECREAGQRSKVYIISSLNYTRAPSECYYDEDGAFHFHDSTTTVTSFTCTNGHSWSGSEASPCLSCDWKAEVKDAVHEVPGRG